MSLNAVLIACAVVLACSLCHNSVADDESRTFSHLVGKNQSRTNLVRVVAVDFQHVPSPRLILHACVFLHYDITFGRELNLVSVVEHDEVAELEQSGNTASALRNFLLHATV